MKDTQLFSWVYYDTKQEAGGPVYLIKYPYVHEVGKKVLKEISACEPIKTYNIFSLKFSGSWGQPGPEKESEDSCALCTLKQYLASPKTFKVRKSLLPFPDPCPLWVVSYVEL